MRLRRPRLARQWVSNVPQATHGDVLGDVRRRQHLIERTAGRSMCRLALVRPAPRGDALVAVAVCDPALAVLWAAVRGEATENVISGLAVTIWREMLRGNAHLLKIHYVVYFEKR